MTPSRPTMASQTIYPESDPTTNELYGIRVSHKEYMFLAQIRQGQSPTNAAAIAGYKNPASTIHSLLQRPHIQSIIASINADINAQTPVTRERVTEMIEQAFALAESIEDPRTMIAAAAELSKMYGHYAPEKKVLHLPQLSSNHDISSLSDDALIEMLSLPTPQASLTPTQGEHHDND